MRRLFCVFVTLAAFGAAMADVSIAKVMSIVKSRAPGAKYSAATVGKRNGRDVWFVQATKDGRTRTITIDKRTGQVIADTGGWGHPVTRAVPDRAVIKHHGEHTPKGKAYGYWEHHQQGKKKHEERAIERHEEKHKGHALKPEYKKQDDNPNGHGHGHGG